MSPLNLDNTDASFSNLTSLSSYLVCVEPQSHATFAVNMGLQTAQTVKINEDSPLHDGILNKIRREEFKIDNLLNRTEKQTNWDFDTEYAQIYRHQMIPFYLLEKEANEFPLYVDNSTLVLPKRRGLSSKVKVQIDLTSIRDLLQNEEGQQKPEEEEIFLNSNKKILDESSDSEEKEEIQKGFLNIPAVSLLTTANKLTKYVLETLK